MADAYVPPPGSLEGRVAVVTGASSGIGRETARALAAAGAEVLTVSRGSGDGAAVAERLRAETGSDAVRFLPADLASVDDTRRVAAEIREVAPRLDVLVNNAGAFFSQRRTSPDGFELTFALNHLAYFVLTLELLPALVAAGSPERPARVVSTSSGAERMGHIHWDDPMLERDYGGWKAYGQSKLANLLFTFELDRRLHGRPVTANAFHPGFVATGFGDAGGVMGAVFGLAQRIFGRTPEEGAATAVHLATDPRLVDTSGRYFKDAEIATPSREAQDPQAQARLWRLSLELTGYERDPTEAPAAPAAPSGAPA